MVKGEAEQFFFSRFTFFHTEYCNCIVRHSCLFKYLHVKKTLVISNRRPPPYFLEPRPPPMRVSINKRYRSGPKLSMLNRRGGGCVKGSSSREPTYVIRQRRGHDPDWPPPSVVVTL